MTDLNESALEQQAIQWFAELGFQALHGQDIAPGEPAAERDSYEQVILPGRLREAIDRLNPDIPAAAREDAFRKVSRPASPALIVNNQAFHDMLQDTLLPKLLSGELRVPAAVEMLEGV